jgi:O-methyltransferase / aklanonic acid methyltransferase
VTPAPTDVFARAAQTYDAVGPRHFTYFARKLVNFAALEPGSYVLDVATGTGAVLLAAAERLGGTGRIVGIDVTETMLNRASAEVRRQSLRRVELRTMDAHRLEFANETFDYVLCSFSFLSFADKQRALQEFRRVLTAGGQVCLLDSYGWFFQHDARWTWQEDVLRSFGALPATETQPYRLGYLERALKGAGFEGVATREESCALRFRDEEEWWSWMWSHGSRALLEAVDPDQLDKLKRTLFRGMDACKHANGMIHGTLCAQLARGQARAA